MHNLIDMDKNEQNSQSMCEIHEDFFDDEKSQTEEIPLSGSRFFFIIASQCGTHTLYTEKFGYVLAK